MAQSSIHTFIASLEANLSTIFPAAEVSFDGQNLSITFKRSDENGDFVMEESGSIAVHVRPDHIFVPHCIMEGSSRTLTLEDQTVFAGGEFDDLGEEFEDGHGNTMWMFQFPEERNTMSELVCGLAKISYDHFFAQ
jgi:hypothetical protein